MAVPDYPLEVWAWDAYHLPNADRPNKIRPIDDLWQKGYDMGQRPDVEAWNYMWYMQTSWLKYLSDERIPELDTRFLRKDLNLSDLANKAVARTNLDVYSKGESEARYVNVTGDEMTGPLKAPRINFPSATLNDLAWIETVVPAQDRTYLDFGIGDNFGDKSSGEVDVIRWRFSSLSGIPAYSLMELHAQAENRAFLEVYGSANIRDDLRVGQNMSVYGQLDVAGNINTPGAVTAAYARIDGNLDLRNPGNHAQVATHHVDGNISGSIWGGYLKDYIDTKTVTEAALGQERGWYRDHKTGFIIQWAVGQWKGWNDETFDTITFPIPFPNECLTVNVGLQLQAESNRADGFGQVAGWNATMCRACVQWPSGSSSWETGMRTIVWAIGR